MISREDIYKIIRMNTQNFDLSELKTKKNTKYYEVKIHEIMNMFGDDFYEELVNTIHDDILKKYDKEIIEIYSESTGIFCIYIKNTNKMNEAEYKGRKVKLGKPMRGDVKKFKVYVRDPKTNNVKKVNFGAKGHKIKRDKTKHRKAFRARHKCDTAKDRTTPRYWSCRFWGKNPVSDLLREVIEPNSIDLDNFKKKNYLCPHIYDENEKMNKDVRLRLLKIVSLFMKFANLHKLPFKDIILTGSLANYNWTENSDLDVHILMDYNNIDENIDLVGEYLKNKKILWSNNYPITVKGHDVEVYVQNTDETHTSTGLYSIMENKWIEKPTKEITVLDTDNIQMKSADIMNFIDELEKTDNEKLALKKTETLFEKLKKMRKSGLEKEGEFSVENIIFKILRSNGYLEKLVNLKNRLITKKLTLEDYFSHE